VTRCHVSDASSDDTRLLPRLGTWPDVGYDNVADQKRSKRAVPGSEKCRGCRGVGWKFLGLRRSLGWAGDAGERALLQRARTVCLACLGRGTPPLAAASPESEKATDDDSC
jgi:hypothetical protein